MELKKNPQDNGQQPSGGSYYQQNPTNGMQSPYGQPQAPYGQTNYSQSQTPNGQGYGQPQDPYNQGNGYYNQSPQNTQDPYGAFGAMQTQATFNQSMNQTTYNGGQQESALGNTVAALSGAMANSVLTCAFLYMFIALLVTGITSLIVASSPEMVLAIFGSRFGFILIFAIEIGLVFACNAAIKSNNIAVSGLLFFAFAVVNGLTFSVIFLVFTLTSIVQVFFMTAVVFGVMALYGAITKKDLTGWGPILLAGLVGIILGSIINMFIGSSMADFVITIIGVVIFTLYTAYDVNKILKMSHMNTGLSVQVLGMYGAMQLYLDFINLFLKLLRLFGKRK